MARISIALMAFSGLRPESLGNYEGTDGIRLGDFLDAQITEGGIEFTKTPAQLVIRKSLSKARHQCFTFVPEQILTYIKEYVEGRIKGKEQINKDSNLLELDVRGVKRNNF